MGKNKVQIPYLLQYRLSSSSSSSFSSSPSSSSSSSYLFKFVEPDGRGQGEIHFYQEIEKLKQLTFRKIDRKVGMNKDRNEAIIEIDDYIGRDSNEDLVKEQQQEE